MGEQCIDTTLILGWLKDELCLPVLLQDRIVAFNRDGSEGVVISRDPYAKNTEVHGKRQNGATHNENDSPEKRLPQPLP